MDRSIEDNSLRRSRTFWNYDCCQLNKPKFPNISKYIGGPLKAPSRLREGNEEEDEVRGRLYLTDYGDPPLPAPPSARTSPDNDSRSKNTDFTLRKVFKALKLSSRKSPDRCSSDAKSDSSSSSSSAISKKKSTNGNIKKILRQSTTYTYVKGMSGLPFPRPRSANSSPPACGQC
ncbi:hypothetical protein J6590_093714 [Homalodisca vitripennis]|nr:hypothetical protein J6590_093714 [Homalodisca vitripennis]